MLQVSALLNSFICHNEYYEAVDGGVPIVNHADEPDDDFLGDISGIAKEILRDIPETWNTAGTGYYKVSKGQAHQPVSQMDEPEKNSLLRYETIDSGRFTYLTARLSPDFENKVDVDITPGAVNVHGNAGVATIVLKDIIDPAHSYYRVHDGILDITLKKIRSAGS